MTHFADSKHTAYIWVNWLYMNEKQWGIQTAHCISDMSQMEFGKDTYKKWANDDKTIIMFNGTNSGTIQRIHTVLAHAARNFKQIGVEIPHVLFREDDESLGGAVTACGFILPDDVRSVGWDWIRPYEEHWSDAFTPNIAGLQDALEEYAVTTEHLLYHVGMDDSRHKMLSERRGHSGYKDYIDYSNDRFMIQEFNDWMRRQRLA